MSHRAKPHKTKSRGSLARRGMFRMSATKGKGGLKSSNRSISLPARPAALHAIVLKHKINPGICNINRCCNSASIAKKQVKQLANLNSTRTYVLKSMSRLSAKGIEQHKKSQKSITKLFDLRRARISVCSPRFLTSNRDDSFPALLKLGTSSTNAAPSSALGGVRISR